MVKLKSVLAKLDPVDGPPGAVVFETVPNGGLANQLRGMTSSMLLAQELKRDFFLNWNPHEDIPGYVRVGPVLSAGVSTDDADLGVHVSLAAICLRPSI